jgi:hypothetical protein
MYVSRSTIAGTLIYILNHKKEICKGGRTGIWFENRFKEADSKGRILIPYGK